MSWLELTAADGARIPAWVARPPGTPRGGLVLLQEIFGVNSHIRAVAQGYADAGYLVVVPAIFHRVQADVDLGYTQADIQAGIALKAAAQALPEPGVLQDVQAAVGCAAEAGKVGVVGYCYGGLLAWRAACTLHGLAAAVPYYGGGMTAPAEVARHAQCPVLAHFGERDHGIPLEGVHAFAKAHPAVRVEVYAADHGFNCDQRPAFDAPSAALALERTLAFFAEHVG